MQVLYVAQQTRTKESRNCPQYQVHHAAVRRKSQRHLQFIIVVNRNVATQSTTFPSATKRINLWESYSNMLTYKAPTPLKNVLAATVYTLWIERNQRIFQQKA